MPLRSIAFLLFFLGSSATSLVYPMAGVICYLVLYHVYPETTWWGKSLAPLGLRYSFICGACLLVGTVLNLNRLRFGRRAFHPVEWAILFFLLAMLLSTATGMGWDGRAELLLDKMVKVFLFALLMSHVVVTQRGLWQLVVVLCLAALYLGHEAYVAPRGAFANNRLNGIGGPDFRESSGLAIHLCALLPFVVVLFRQKFWLWKGLAFLAAGFAVNAVILCRTRSAVVAGGLAGMLSLAYVPRRHRRWLVAMFCLGCCGALYLSDQYFWDRVATVFASEDQRDQSAASRLEIWGTAWEMIKAHPFGVGIGHFMTEIGKYTENPAIARRDAHNSYVLCVAELGWLGAAAYLATLALAWRTLGRSSRLVRECLPDADRLTLIIFANRIGLLVYILAGLFSSRLYSEGQWLLIAITVCVARTVENEVRGQERSIVVLEPCLPDLPLEAKGALA